MSFVAWSKNVPDKMVTNPQSSVIISAALCWSQSCIEHTRDCNCALLNLKKNNSESENLIFRIFEMVPIKTESNCDGRTVPNLEHNGTGKNCK
jgi:hypothetical protein